MRIVDLTMTWPDVPTYPGHPEPTTHRIASFETHGKQVSKLEIGTHSGTHIDAPRHYIEGGGTVDNIPLETLCGPALLLDLTNCTGSVTADHLRRAAEGRLVPEGSFKRILLRFDGHKRLGSMDYYFGQPWLSEAAANWLVACGCKMVCMDTPMPDGPEDIKTMPVHKILLGAGVVIGEYLVDLDKIKADTFKLTVAPLKIKGGDGAPARIWVEIDD
jgi:arylformamidase